MARRRDAAEGGVVGEVLLVALAIFAASLLVLLFGMPEPEAPAAVGIVDAGAAQEGTKTFTVVTLHGPLRWGELEPLLDGAPLAYSSALLADGTYCIGTGGACVATGSFDPEAIVMAGHQVKIHHSALAGKTFVLRHETTNTLLFQKLL
jgi:hypothetical protein